MYSVHITEGDITIKRDGDEEVLYWEMSEWEEDCELVLFIANAIRMALSEPLAMDRKLKAMGKKVKPQED